MTDETDDLIRRLHTVASSVRAAEPALADDLQAAIRYKQLSSEARENASVRDSKLISRLEERAALAIKKNESPLAKDLQDAVELIRGQ